MVVFIGLIFLLAIYICIQVIRCKAAVRVGKSRLSTYKVKTAKLSYGEMKYVDQGEGAVILSIHGIFGGYDQAYETCVNYASDCRIIAPARFGYLGSEVCGDGAPAEQAKAYVELLDILHIDKVYLLATSAGGSVAIRFALDYPERVKGLILYCSAMPRSKKPKRVIEYKMNPSLMCNDYSLYLTAPFYHLFFGIDSTVINGIIPCADRKKGVEIDMAITNLDMIRNYDGYKVEELKMSTLIFQAKDDRLVRYSESKKSVERFANCKFIPFDKGGHLMVGDGENIESTVLSFIKNDGQFRK